MKLEQKLGRIEVSAPSTATVDTSFTVNVAAYDDNGAPYLRGLNVTATADGAGTLTGDPIGIAALGNTGTGSFKYSAEGLITITFGATDPVSDAARTRDVILTVLAAEPPPPAP